MCKHGGSVRMAVQSAEEIEMERRVAELVQDLDNRFRVRLREGLSQMKRSPREPRPFRKDIYSQILAFRSHPTRQLAEALAPMMVAGASQYTMRAVVAVFFDWLDCFYASDLPPLKDLAPRLAIEAGEATAATIVSACDPSIGQLQRTEKEIRELRICAELAEKRAADDVRQAAKRPSFSLAR